MTIKQQGGIFGRNPTFNNVEVDGTLTVAGTTSGATGSYANLLASTFLSVGNAHSQNGVFDAVVGSADAGTGDNTGIVIVSNSTGKGWLGFNDANDAQIPGQVGYNHSTNAMEFYTSGSYKFQNGNLVMDNGKGIDFSATAGTGTSELFDDYEEGTWTPAGSGITLTSASGSYTKIGRVVAYFGEVVFPVTSDANLALLTGLPFVPANDTDSRGGGNIGYTDYSASTLFALSQTLGRVYFSDPAGLLTNANLSGKTIQFGGTYYVS